MTEQDRIDTFWDRFVCLQTDRRPVSPSRRVAKAVELLAEYDALLLDKTISRSGVSRLLLWKPDLMLFLAYGLRNAGAFTASMVVVRGITEIEPSRYEAWELLLKLLQQVDPESIARELPKIPRELCRTREFEFAEFLLREIGRVVEESIAPELFDDARATIVRRDAEKP